MFFSRQRRTLATLLLSLLPISTALAQPVEMIWVFAESTPRTTRRAMGYKIQSLIGTELEPKSVLRVVNASNNQTIGTLTVPAGSRNARLRNRNLLPPFKKIVAFLKSKPNRTSNQLNLQRLPNKIRELRSTDHPLQIVLIGSPMFNDPKHTAWKFNPQLPSDGCLKADHFPLTGGVGKFPVGTQVIWIAPADDLAVDPPILSALYRFWRLFFQTHGATLVRIGEEPAATFQFGRPMFDGKLVIEDQRAVMQDPRIKTVVAKSVVRKIERIPTTKKKTVTVLDEYSREVEMFNAPVLLPDTIPVQPPVKIPKKKPLSIPLPVNQQVSVKTPVPVVAPVNTDIIYGTNSIGVIPSDDGNIVLLVDLSKSMRQWNDIDRDERFPIVQNDLCHFIRSMNCKQFAVIGFWSYKCGQDNHRLDYELSRHFLWSPRWAAGNKYERETACKMVNSWECKGGTPTLAALEMACSLEGITSLILYSDGQPTSTKPAQVYDYVKKMSAAGITVHTVGAGLKLGAMKAADIEFLREVARLGGGTFIKR